MFLIILSFNLKPHENIDRAGVWYEVAKLLVDSGA
jgi:hypothetical protein